MAKRKVEIFSAGCAVCEETIQTVKSLACPSCEIEVLDMQDSTMAKRAQTLGVKSVPAVAVNGRLVDCCEGSGIDVAQLKKADIGSR